MGKTENLGLRHIDEINDYISPETINSNFDLIDSAAGTFDETISNSIPKKISFFENDSQYTTLEKVRNIEDLNERSFNDIQKAGIYLAWHKETSPEKDSYPYILKIRNSASEGWISQCVLNMKSKNLYHRVFDKSWSAWKKIIVDEDLKGYSLKKHGHIASEIEVESQSKDLETALKDNKEIVETIKQTKQDKLLKDQTKGVYYYFEVSNGRVFLREKGVE